MSDNIFESKSLIVTRYVGPESEEPDRQRWQFTPLDGEGFEHHGVAVLSRMEAIRLAQALRHDLLTSAPYAGEREPIDLTLSAREGRGE